MRDSTPSLLSVLEKKMKFFSSKIRVSEPGKVKSFDSSKNKAQIQLLIKERVVAESESRRELPPVINDVPVVFEGSGGHRLIYPVSVGDVVMVVFSDRSLDKWLVSGGEVDPGDDRSHHIADAVAYPGLMDFGHVQRASRFIEFTESGDVKIGAALGHQVTIMGTTYRSAEDALLTLLSTFLGTLAPGLITAPQVTAAAAVVTGIATFQSAAASYVTQHVKVT